MRALAVGWSGLALVVGLIAAPRRLPAQTVSYAFINGQWLDGNKFIRKTRYAVDGVFRAGRPARVDSVIDLAGGFVIPPFGDAHTHNLDGPFNLETVRDAYLAEGTFYVQVLVNSRSGAAQVRDQFNHACTLDVRYANGGITGTLSHPFLAYEPRAMGLYTDWAAHSREIWRSRKRENDAYWFVDSLADLNAKWPRILAGRPDLIKIFLLDASETAVPPPDTGLSSGHGLKPSLVPEVVRRAHAAGLRVTAHIETVGDFRIAVRAGVDLLAHLPGYEMPAMTKDPDVLLTPADAELAARARMAVMPTLSLALAAQGPDSAALVSRRREVQRNNLALLRRHGVEIVVGSDWFGRTAGGEVQAMRSLGLWSNAELLSMWSNLTPRTMFPGRKIGKLAPGYEASFLVLQENPLRDLGAVQGIRMRVKQGCVMEDAGMRSSEHPTGTLVVTNMNDNTATVLDAATDSVLATLPTGVGPHEVAVSHDGRWAVVSNYGDRAAPGNTLTVISVDSLKATRTIVLGPHRRPHGIAFLPGDSLVAVTSEVSAAVLLVSFADGSVRSVVPTGGRTSHMVALPPTGPSRAFISNIADGTISQLDLDHPGAPRVLPAAKGDEGIAVSPDGRTVWVGSNAEKIVVVIDAGTGLAVDTLRGFGLPYRMAVSPDGRSAVVTDPERAEVRIFDARTRAQRFLIPIPSDSLVATAEVAGSASPEGVTISADSRWAFVTLQGRNRVITVRLSTGTIAGWGKTGTWSDGIGYSSRTLRR